MENYTPHLKMSRSLSASLSSLCLILKRK